MIKEMNEIITREWMKETIKQLLIFHWKVPELLEKERMNRLVAQSELKLLDFSFQTEVEVIEVLTHVVENLLLDEGIPKETLYWLDSSIENEGVEELLDVSYHPSEDEADDLPF